MLQHMHEQQRVAVKKQEYFARLDRLLEEYSKVFIVHADNVGSNQMQKTRLSLRGDAVVLMGKNTMIRKVIKAQLSKNPDLEKLLGHVKGNVGFVFTNKDLKDIRDRILSNKRGAPAKAGAISPVDVVVPAGPTGMDPSQTSFFQALNIATKINKGQVEIVNNVNLIKKGDKVGQSEATLLQKLNINPFFYGLTVLAVYDSGSMFLPEILDITDEDLCAKIGEGLASVAALSLSTGYFTVASVPHSIIRAYKNVIGLALESEYSFPRVEKVKEALKAGPRVAAAAPAAAKAAAPAKEEKKVEEEEEETDMGLSLFD
eukprot:tig00000615_g2599.t1